MYPVALPPPPPLSSLALQQRCARDVVLVLLSLVSTRRVPAFLMVVVTEISYGDRPNEWRIIFSDKPNALFELISIFNDPHGNQSFLSIAIFNIFIIKGNILKLFESTHDLSVIVSTNYICIILYCFAKQVKPEMEKASGLHCSCDLFD